MNDNYLIAFSGKIVRTDDLPTFNGEEQFVFIIGEERIVDEFTRVTWSKKSSWLVNKRYIEFAKYA